MQGLKVGKYNTLKASIKYQLTLFERRVLVIRLKMLHFDYPVRKTHNAAF